MYLYVIIKYTKRALFGWNAWPQTSRPISVIDKNMYLCENECSTDYLFKKLNFKNKSKITIIKNIKTLIIRLKDLIFEKNYALSKIKIINWKLK